MKKNNIYLDNAATTNLTKDVKDYVISMLDNFYNPSSMYKASDDIKNIIDACRNKVAEFCGAKKDEIIFTSGGSANNSMVVNSFAKDDVTILYSPIAHKSMLYACQNYNKSIQLKVDEVGAINLHDLESKIVSLCGEEFIVCIDGANSEIGTIQDIKDISKIVHSYNGILYIDATGMIPYIKVNVNDLGIDIMGFSGHKLHSLKGIGVLYKKDDIPMNPFIYGSQEKGLFSGTENTIGIASLYKAIDTYAYNYYKLKDISDSFYRKLINSLDDIYLIGDKYIRVPNNLYICFTGVDGEALLHLLDTCGIYVSTGSACTSGDLQPSNTLVQIGIPKEDLHSCIRFTFSGNETEEQLDYVIEKLIYYINIIRST